MPDPAVFLLGISRIRAGFLISSGALALAVFAPLVAAQQQETPAPAPQIQPGAQEPQSTPASQPATPETPVPAPAQTSPPPASAESAPASETGAASPEEAGGISEDELRSMLVGKQIFLRNGYLDNALSFNERGVLIGHSPQGSYTLCEIQIDKVHLSKHKVELDGQRFGLHFLGALPYEDPTKAVDRVNITPKKKELRITIDREIVVKPKLKKGKNQSAAQNEQAAAAGPASTTTASDASSAPPADTTDASELHAEIAAAPPEDRPADEKSVTTTTSSAHAAQVLKDALDKIFAQGFDSRMMAAMPDFWKLYYEAAANKTDYRPNDPSVLRDNTVDRKAQLLTTFQPASNQFAQDHGVAGMSLYHVVVGADGKPAEIAVARPIGFGLDESAVDSIRKAAFSPAMKDGKPVPIMLDLIVEFRIYSKRTDVVSNQAAERAAGPVLPGPYSVQH
jgi:hypothetical protein